ncbi:MAG: hypothetical protein HY308_16265 [Gammaproteobacteria bacterium]|nr:hypothetical protein [Gammaproteobacteria bacterium]
MNAEQRLTLVDVIDELKAVSTAGLVPQLHMALKRAMVVLEAITALDLPANDGSAILSERQIEILRWLHYGKTNVEIAEITGITHRNVKYHIQQIFVKLNVSNRTQAVTKALALNIIASVDTRCAWTAATIRTVNG